MRPRIVGLDVDAMAWTPLGPPGLFSKMLSRDEETGARTALQRMDPGLGYTAPTVAHYHLTYEEILGIEGYFSFDQRTWVVPRSYVFHPPRTVHGFNSMVPEESLFLSRVGENLAFNFVEEPEYDDLYVVDGDAPPRPPAAYGDPIAALGWSETILLGQQTNTCLLSRDPSIGEGSALARLPKGWASPAQQREDYLEIFVLEGGLSADDEPAISGRAYFFIPPGEPVPALRAEKDSEIYVNFGQNFA